MSKLSVSGCSIIVNQYRNSDLYHFNAQLGSEPVYGFTNIIKPEAMVWCTPEVISSHGCS